MKQLLTTLFIATLIVADAQSLPVAQAKKCFGGSYKDEARSIQQTADGGCIIAGSADSYDGDVSGNHGGYDYWVIKLNRKGFTEWQKCFGGSYNDFAAGIEQTKDGGYVVTGCSYSDDGDVSGNHGLNDYWILKLNNAGDIQWQKCLGGSGSDNAASITQTTDGGYVIAGYSYSDDGDVSGHHGIFNYADYWVVKLDEAGNMKWQKSIGGSNHDIANSVQQTPDGGCIVAGYTASNNGDVSGNHGFDDCWLVKLSNTGAIQWQKCFGGSNADQAYSIQQAADKGYIVAGTSLSTDGDVRGNHGGYDYWVIKLNMKGSVEWQKCLGGSGRDEAHDIQQTKDGGYIIAGYSGSADGDVSGNHGYYDYWIVKLNTAGNLQWQKCLGGNSQDAAQSIQQTPDGGYAVAGYTYSKNNGDVRGNHGFDDYWIVKLNSGGNLAPQQYASFSSYRSPFSITISPNPVQSILHIKGLSSNTNYELRIINENGAVTMQSSAKNISSYNMDVSKLAAGIYYMQAEDVMVKFVKK